MITTNGATEIKLQRTNVVTNSIVYLDDISLITTIKTTHELVTCHILVWSLQTITLLIS